MHNRFWGQFTRKWKESLTCSCAELFVVRVRFFSDDSWPLATLNLFLQQLTMHPALECSNVRNPFFSQDSSNRDCVPFHMEFKTQQRNSFFYVFRHHDSSQHARRQTEESIEKRLRRSFLFFSSSCGRFRPCLFFTGKSTKAAGWLRWWSGDEPKAACEYAILIFLAKEGELRKYGEMFRPTV